MHHSPSRRILSSLLSAKLVVRKTEFWRKLAGFPIPTGVRQMSQPVSQTMTLLCDVVRTLPVGTNLGVLHLLWMMISGYLLISRGAIIPGLSQMGLPDK